MSFTLTITTGTTNEHGALTEVELSIIRDVAQNAIVELFGGVTLTHGFGSWKDPSGKVVSEPVDLWTVHSSADGVAWRDLAKTICGLYRQERVSVTKVDNVRFDLIGEDS